MPFPDRFPNLTTAQALLNLAADITLTWAQATDIQGRTVWRAVCNDGSWYDIGRIAADYDWWLAWIQDEYNRTEIVQQSDLIGLRVRAQRHYNARLRLQAWTDWMLSHNPG